MIRTRFAPSPTGHLHIGGFRTILYCYAWAKKNDGRFILRLEDTDRSRYSKEAEDSIYKTIELYGLVPDEGPIWGGEFGPYVQSERLDLYKKYAEELVAKGAAYYCFLTEQEYEIEALVAKQEKRPFRSPHRNLTSEEVETRMKNNESYVIRQRMPEDREIEFEDGVQGKIRFNTKDVNDGVLLKSDGFATYHLAMLVDDYLMQISHVFRGFEWISSIPKHVLLYEAMGWEMPKMYHLSIILDPEGGKLSKRKGATSAIEFIKEGYLPEAVNNFLMLLGWSPKNSVEFGESESEVYSLDDFIEKFELEDLNNSNPVFDDNKLIWFNGYYLRNLSMEEYINRLKNFFELNDIDFDFDDSTPRKLELIKDRAKTLKETYELLTNFDEFNTSIENWDIKQLKRVDNKTAKILVEKYIELVSNLDNDSDNWKHEEWEDFVRSTADSLEVKHGDAFMVFRIAVWSVPYSPPLFEVLQILGKDEVKRRLGVSVVSL